MAASFFDYYKKYPTAGRKEIISMSLYHVSVIGNNSAAKTIGAPAMSICVADKYALSLPIAGTGLDTNAWNPSSRQSLMLPIRS